MGLLEGKVCLVTGAGRGIGHATAKRFAEEGAVVYMNSLPEENIDDVCAKIAADNNTTVTPLYFDVRDEAAAKKAIMQIRKESGGLDVLVNNAGVMKDAILGMITKDLMQEVFDINVFSVMLMTQLASKIMMPKKSGAIVNISSIVGLEGYSGQMVYSASKGAVAALTKAAAKELAARGIRVNAVAPGMINTQLFRNIGEDNMNQQLGNIRMGRFGEPEEVADAILFLASDQSRYITGEIVNVNGSAMV